MDIWCLGIQFSKYIFRSLLFCCSKIIFRNIFYALNSLNSGSSTFIFNMLGWVIAFYRTCLNWPIWENHRNKAHLKKVCSTFAKWLQSISIHVIILFHINVFIGFISFFFLFTSILMWKCIDCVYRSFQFSTSVISPLFSLCTSHRHHLCLSLIESMWSHCK